MKQCKLENEDRTCCKAHGMKMLALLKGNWKASAGQKEKVEQSC